MLRLLVTATTVLALVVAPSATASPQGSGDATASAGVSKKKFKKLRKQVAALQEQLDGLEAEPGPRGPQGPRGAAGSAPACAGNGSGDTMVSAGAVCIDRYEASVWSSPTGGTQYGVDSDDYPCNDNGQDCDDIYARSVAGVTPSRFITYFQAQQALANVGKRLPRNGEWQQAVAGTPESTTCNISIGGPTDTGANAGCISEHGANDMVGNAYEWVEDWMPQGTATPGWGGFSDDTMGLAGASTTSGPGAPIRGGSFFVNNSAGPFAISSILQPTHADFQIGFRGAR